MPPHEILNLNIIYHNIHSTHKLNLWINKIDQFRLISSSQVKVKIRIKIRISIEDFLTVIELEIISATLA